MTKVDVHGFADQRVRYPKETVKINIVKHRDRIKVKRVEVCP
jgi:hypothetical protein